jgi:hypothetical protein
MAKFILIVDDSAMSTTNTFYKYVNLDKVQSVLFAEKTLTVYISFDSGGEALKYSFSDKQVFDRVRNSFQYNYGSAIQ